MARKCSRDAVQESQKICSRSFCTSNNKHTSVRVLRVFHVWSYFCLTLYSVQCHKSTDRLTRMDSCRYPAYSCGNVCSAESSVFRSSLLPSRQPENTKYFRLNTLILILWCTCGMTKVMVNQSAPSFGHQSRCLSLFEHNAQMPDKIDAKKILTASFWTTGGDHGDVLV